MIAAHVDIKRKAFAGKPVLRQVHFDIHKGEVISIVAPSGAGKSTLLNLVAGIDSDFDGRIAIDAADKNHCAVVFQEPRLMPWLTVGQNVELAAVDACEHWLARMELSTVADRYPHQLSLGMQRRAAIARALAARPKLLLLDEAFVSLDRPLAAGIRTVVLDAMHEFRASALLATHDLHEAVAMSDRVIFLSTNPATVVHELVVPLPRPRQPATGAVVSFCHELVERFPLLLRGVGGTRRAAQ